MLGFRSKSGFVVSLGSDGASGGLNKCRDDNTPRFVVVVVVVVFVAVAAADSSRPTTWA